jgi:hypothetical protein
MKMRCFSSAFSLVFVAILFLACAAGAQRARLGKVQSLQATSDNAGQHPASLNITGPATLTCLNSVSEVPNGRPTPSCRVTAPGFNGSLNIGQKISMTSAGTVTLTCNGQGPMLRCSARVDIPPPTQ